MINVAQIGSETKRKKINTYYAIGQIGYQRGFIRGIEESDVLKMGKVKRSVMDRFYDAFYFMFH